MGEKSLIKIEKLNIFQKISGFLKKIFYKNSIEEKTEENVIKQESNIIKELKEEQNILNLQEQYEAGKIKEENISEEDKDKLVELYKEQIKTLENNVALYKNSLKNYKEKILKIRSEIASEN